MTEPTEHQVEIAARVFCCGFPLASHPSAMTIVGLVAKGRCRAPDCLCWEQGKELTRAALRAAMNSTHSTSESPKATQASGQHHE